MEENCINKRETVQMTHSRLECLILPKAAFIESKIQYKLHIVKYCYKLKEPFFFVVVVNRISNVITYIHICIYIKHKKYI